jgi:phosphate uptake regulator
VANTIKENAHKILSLEETVKHKEEAYEHMHIMHEELIEVNENLEEENKRLAKHLLAAEKEIDVTAVRLKSIIK